MSYHTPITEADLHAYVDGQLSPARRQEVEEYLAESPEAAAQVKHYRDINQGLHALYDPVLSEPLPPQLSVTPRPRRWPVRVAAALGWVTLGAVLGWALKPAVVPDMESALRAQLVQPAAFAHRVFAVEKLHPVEVTAADEQHLIKWLSRRLDTPIKAPSLTGQGYALVGGRLLPSTDRMAAQFMYQKQNGQRITLYIRRGVWSNATSGFSYLHEDGVGTFYWVDGPLGYALSGDVEKPELLALAHTVYQSLAD
jgi:anti-sigma factor RsiW